jgi:hypothetical protein
LILFNEIRAPNDENIGVDSVKVTKTSHFNPSIILIL